MKIFFYFLVLLLVPGVLIGAKPTRERRDWDYWDMGDEHSTKPTLTTASAALTITTSTAIVVVIKKEQEVIFYASKN